MRTRLRALIGVLVVLALGLMFVVTCAGDDDADEATEPATITLILDALDGFKGLTVSSWVLPIELSDEKMAFGGAQVGDISDDPFSAREVMHPQGERYFDIVTEEIATFEPGTYRFIIEAYVSSGPMRYGCEALIEVVESEPLALTVSSLPTYEEGGFHWTPAEQLQYPQCPGT